MDKNISNAQSLAAQGAGADAPDPLEQKPADPLPPQAKPGLLQVKRSNSSADLESAEQQKKVKSSTAAKTKATPKPKAKRNPKHQAGPPTPDPQPMEMGYFDLMAESLSTLKPLFHVGVPFCPSTAKLKRVQLVLWRCASKFGAYMYILYIYRSNTHTQAQRKGYCMYLIRSKVFEVNQCACLLKTQEANKLDLRNEKAIRLLKPRKSLEKYRTMNPSWTRKSCFAP